MDSTRWAAIVARDKASDSAFVYCVKSTKIYCRPTCAARLARRANVHFCDTSAEAEAAGFRPCKRCRPELLSYTPQDDKIQRACQTICRFSLGPGNPRLDDLAKEAGLTKHHFHRLFKKKTGLTPKQYAEVLRASDVEATTSSSTPSMITESSGVTPTPADICTPAPPVFNLDDDTPLVDGALSDMGNGSSFEDTVDPSLILNKDGLDRSDPWQISEIQYPQTWLWFDMDFPADPNAQLTPS